jgi:hypothetical protein
VKRITCVLALLGLVASCRTQDNTLIVVEVGSELAVPSQLDAVRIEVTGPTANSSKIYPLGSSRELPIHLALVPDAANDASLTVKATGMLEHVEIVWQAVRVAFVPGESKLLRLNLTRPCAYVTCRSTESCEAGRCIPVPTITEIPDYVPASSAPATGGGAGVTVIGGSGGAVITGGLTSVAGISSGGTSTTGGRVVVGGSGGSGGFGGGGSGGGPPICINGTSCGGDLVGTWAVSSSCLTLSGNMDVTMASLGCNTVPVTGSLQVSGTWTAKADGTYVDATTTKGNMTFTLAPACLSISSVPVQCRDMGPVFTVVGWTNTICTQSGSVCSCKAETTLQGGLGVPSVYASDSGDYALTPTGFKVDDAVEYSSCVQGTKLTLTPKPTVLPITGNMVLQKTCSGASCGTAGVGGGAGTGGRGGSGGSTAGTGGTSRSSSSGGTGGVCLGGDPVGTWDVKSSSLKASGPADISYLGLACSTAQITGTANVTGRLTLTADGKYTDKTVTTGSDTWTLEPQCLYFSGTMVTCEQVGSVFAPSLEIYGYQEFKCATNSAGGCTCQGKINQAGGLGVLHNDITPTGKYRVASDTLLIGDYLTYSYCSQGGQMTVSPRVGNMVSTPYTGTIVLQNSTPSTGGTGGGMGGSTGGAGSGGSSTSSTGSCVSGTPCGGDVVGTWDVISYCLTLNGDFADRGTGLGCDTFKVTGSLQVKGTFVAGADGKFQDKTTTTGSVVVKMDHQCLFMSGTWAQCDLISVAVEALGFPNARCTDAPDGGCYCPATIKQSGNMGLIVADPQTSGVYSLSNNTMVTGKNVLTGAELAYSYCVANNQLTMTPKTSSPPTTGTIVLQKSK